MWPDRAIGPGVKFENIADGSAFDVFVGHAPALTSMALIAHLGDDVALFLVNVSELIGFINRPGQWLFRVAMDAHGHRGVGRSEVSMVRSGNEDDVEFFAVVCKHFTPISVTFGFLPTFFAVYATPAGFVDFGERDALAAFLVGFTSMSTCPSAYGDKADLQFTVLVLCTDYRREGQ